MKILIKTVVIQVLISLSILISAQEIKVTEFRSAIRDISARENAVLDANGDACAIIKTRTGLRNLKFSCDLEIRKIENHDGEYWLWVSPNTSKISIEAEGLGSLDYNLPKYTEEYNVYVLFLTAILPDKIIYKNINSVLIQTEPDNAEVYINSAFMGYSPIRINTPEDTLRYEIQKKKYISITGELKYSDKQNELDVHLKKSNRVFVISSVGGNKLGTTFFGLQTGKIGHTGWYFSVVPPLMGKEYIMSERVYYGLSVITIDPEKFLSITGVSLNNHYVKLQNTNNTFFNHYRFKAGITQNIFKKTFLLAGIGYAGSTRYYRMIVTPYSSDTQLELPIKKTFYGIAEREIHNLVFETGLIYNVYKEFLLNLNISTTGQRFQSFFPLEFSAGFGFKF
jgi:hypothetical protein